MLSQTKGNRSLYNCITDRSCKNIDNPRENYFIYTTFASVKKSQPRRTYVTLKES